MESRPQDTDSFNRRNSILTSTVQKHHRYLLRFAYGYTRQWQDAENVMQELWRYAMLYLPAEKLDDLGLLRMKVHQLTIDLHRAQARRPQPSVEELPEMEDTKDMVRPSKDDDEADLRNEFFAQFPDLAANEDQKQAFWLSARYDFTYAEIAEKLGKSTSTIGDWVPRVRTLLAQALSKGDKNNG